MPRVSLKSKKRILKIGWIVFLILMGYGIQLKASDDISGRLEQDKNRQKAAGTAIVGGTIIDGTGQDPIRDGLILIEGQTITEVRARNSMTFPESFRKIDAHGKFIIPGLMDSNVHFVISNGRSIEFMARFERRFEELIEEAAQVTLKNGITTVFETWGPLQPLKHVRDRINRGETQGSRMFVAGNIVGLSGPFGEDFNAEAEDAATAAFVKRINSMWEQNVGPELAYLTPDQLRGAVRNYISTGIDFLKYGSSGHGTDNSRFIVFSLEAQKAVVEECHQAGITVQAHTTTNESLRLAVEAGVDLITHCGVTGHIALSDATVTKIIKKKIPCGIIPKTSKRYSIEMANNQQSRLAPLSNVTLEVWRNNLLKLIEADIPLLLNTDGGLWSADYIAQFDPEHWIDYGAILGEGLFIRAQGMADLGVSPMDIIQAGTRNIASAYQKLDQLGTIEKGKIADLVILNENPLVDIQNLRKIFMIVKDGKVVDREKLPLKKILSPAQPKLFLGH
jgi:imidazolonepropionase-like amidohydrolase